MKIILYFCCFLFVLFADALLTPASALTLSPSTVQLETAPGRSQTFILKVYNEEQQPMKITPTIMDWGYDAKGKKIFRPPGTLPLSIAKYISYPAESFILMPHKSRHVQMSITVPDSMTGGHQAVVFFQAMPVVDPGKNKSKVAVAMRLGAILLQEHKNTTVIKSRIKDIHVKIPAKGGPQIDLDIVNESNTHIYAEATAALLTTDERLIGTIKLPSTLVLRGRTSRLSAQYKKSLSPGAYKLLITYKYRDKYVSVYRSFEIVR